jgi:hypothetical protein
MSLTYFIKGSWKDLLIAAFFISFAAALNASMDTLDHHYKESIFTKYGSYFQSDWTRKYEKDPSGDLIYPLQRKQWNLGLFKMDVHPLFFDAWHLFKSAMIFLIICYGATFVFARERIVFYYKKIEHWYLLIMLIAIYSAVWILTFNVFYNHWLLL